MNLQLKHNSGGTSTVNVLKAPDGSVVLDGHWATGHERLERGVSSFSNITPESAIALANALIDAVEAP